MNHPGHVLVTDRIGAGPVRLLRRAAVVGLVDEFLRPCAGAERAEPPGLRLRFGVLGGIEIHGLVGALVRALVIACVLVLAWIYRGPCVTALGGGA